MKFFHRGIALFLPLSRQINLIIRSLLMRIGSRPHGPTFPRAAVLPHVARMHFDATVIPLDFDQIVQPRRRFGTVFRHRAKRTGSNDMQLSGWLP